MVDVAAAEDAEDLPWAVEEVAAVAVTVAAEGAVEEVSFGPVR